MDLNSKKTDDGEGLGRSNSEPLYPERENYIEFLILIAHASGALATPLRVTFEGANSSCFFSRVLRCQYPAQTTPNREPALALRSPRERRNTPAREQCARAVPILRHANNELEPCADNLTSPKFLGSPPLAHGWPDKPARDGPTPTPTDVEFALATNCAEMTSRRDAATTSNDPPPPDATQQQTFVSPTVRRRPPDATRRRRPTFPAARIQAQK